MPELPVMVGMKKSKEGLAEASDVEAHPLDGCDPKECYDTMMSERNELIKARREAEDSLVKTVIQLASALLVLMAGFAVKDEGHFEGATYGLFSLAIVALSFSVIAGLAEHYFSSKAYHAQQILVEDFYSKKISKFREPSANWWVRRLQSAQFIAFALSLAVVGGIAMKEIGEKHVREESNSAPSAAPAPSSCRGGKQNRAYQIGGAIHASTSTKEG